MKLNIGCGNKAIDGYVGVDKFQCDAADYICDIENEKLPFDDGSVDAIMLDNVIEHFGDIPKVINELIRVSKKGGVIKIITPHFSALSSWIDPTHIHHLSYFSFDHFEKDSASHYVGKGIRIQKKKLSFGGGIFGLLARLLFRISPKKYEQKYCFIFRASTLTFWLKVSE
jgi:SAM-dependent methyltransferase